ncbi:MAG: carbon-nitrogen hydrolase family protein [Pseudomonadales bacterium]
MSPTCKNAAHFGCIAAIQMNSTPDMQANLENAQRLLAEAVATGARLVVFPENFALLGVEDIQAAGRTEAENRSAQTVRRWLAKKAREYGVWMIAGSIPMASRPGGEALSDRVRAACLVLDDQGHEVARYDKIHLFDVDVEDDYGAYRESDTVEAGCELVVVDTPCGKVGLSICYDLRFAEQYYRLRELGAEIITVPSAFTATTGEAHWEPLLRARAIESQCYLVAPNQTGWHTDSRHSWGHSMIIDPWGRVLDTLPDEPGVISAQVDLSYLKEVRRRMPVAQHHRLQGL